MLRLVILILGLLGFSITTHAQEATEIAEVPAIISNHNAARLIEVVTLPSATNWINDVKFSPNGQQLAVAETGNVYEGFGDVQGKVRLWDTAPWEDMGVLSSEGLSATSLVFSSNNLILAVGNTTGEIQLWSTITQSLGATLSGHDTWVNSLAYGGAGLISGSGAVFNTNTGGDSTVRVWLIRTLDEAEEFRILVPIGAELGAGWGVANSPDGGVIAAGMTNGTVHLWASESGRELAILDGYAWVHTLLFTPDSTQILFSARDGIRVWNVAKAIETFGYIPEYKLIAPLDESEFIFSLALSPDGTMVAAGYQDGTVRLWDMDTGERLIVLEGHTGRVMSLDFSPDGTLLASGGSDGTVRLWGIPAG